MCTPNCCCISCTVVLGQQLATLFHLWRELTTKAHRDLDTVTHDIEASTSALKQLQVMLESDKLAPAKIFTPAGHQDIELLSLKCNLIFKAVILLVQKAAERKRQSSDEDERGSAGANGKQSRPGSGWGDLFGAGPRPKVRRREGGSLCDGISGDSDDEAAGPDASGTTPASDLLLLGPVASLTSMKTFGLIGQVGGQWPWLKNRIMHCQVQLEWARKGLLLHLQMGRLTTIANRAFNDADGDFESQLVVRASVHLQRQSQLKFAKSRARQQERAEIRAQRLRDAAEQSDSESVHSSSSRGSSSTAVVVEDSAEAKSTGEKEQAGGSTVTDPPTPPTPSVPATVTAGAPLPTKGSESQNGKEAPAGKLSSSMRNMSLSLSDTMSAWTHKIFGKEDQFSHDWTSDKLEAWVIRSPGSPHSPPPPAPYVGNSLMKVPFGHQRLQYGLKRARSKKWNVDGLTAFDRYLSGGPYAHVLVNEIVQEANRLQSRERVLLAFTSCASASDSSALAFVVAFLSIRKEKAPISFKDCLGRRMMLPFETCRTWQGMSNTINEAFRLVDGLGAVVIRTQSYELKNAKGELILPSLWEATIQPGDAVVMEMMPPTPPGHERTGCEPRPCGMPSGPPPYCGPLHLVSRQEAGRERFHRLRALQQGAHPPSGPMPFPGFLGPPGPFHGRMPMPPAPMPGGQPPRDVEVLSVRPEKRRRRRFSAPHLHGDEVTEAERRALTFFDFKEELEKTQDSSAADLLGRYTQLQDISGCLDDDWSLGDTSSGSESDGSWLSGSWSSESASIVDD